MVAAFIQWKICPCCGGKHFGNIRAGDTAIDWGSPYDTRASIDNTDPVWAVIEALAGPFSRHIQDVIAGMVNRETGKLVKFERIVPGRPPVTFVQSRKGPFGEGRIIMQHEHKHAHHGGLSETGEVVDQEAFKKNVADYNAKVQSGEVVGVAVAPPLPIPGLPGHYAKTFIVKE